MSCEHTAGRKLNTQHSTLNIAASLYVKKPLAVAKGFSLKLAAD
jgi:hypothetical protein